jgi:ketosteroid isomerase-like protein
MSDRIEEIARAFSGHAFKAAYPYLDEDVTWTLVGERELRGKEAVIKACEESTAYLSDVTTEFRRFRTLVGENWVVDSLAEYTDRDGEVSVVASCDIFDFRDGMIGRIASYNIALNNSNART